MKILITDDDILVCNALKTILQVEADIEITGICTDGKTAISVYQKVKPDILLIDIRMPEMTGLETGKEILRLFPAAKIIFLTTFSDDDYIIKALQMGAKGYLIKQDFESIVPALRAVHLGQNVFGNEIISRLPDLMSNADRFSREETNLTDKEKEIIQLVAEGKSNRELAVELSLSEGTVRNYLSIILEKLQLRDRTQLAVYYYRRG